MKKNIQDEINKKNKNNQGIDDLDFCAEWSNKSNTQKFGFWINNSDGKFKETQTKFKQIPFQIISFPKPFVQIATIIRFYWNKNDVRYLFLIFLLKLSKKNNFCLKKILLKI
jgi:hypothetical protein